MPDEPKPFRLHITERVAPVAEPPPRIDPDHVPAFEDVLAQLRGLFGEEVQTGPPVEPAVLAEIERQLRVTFPDDYRQFVERHGYLFAGPRGALVVFGVAPDDVELPYVVDVRTAARLLSDQLSAELRKSGPLVPVIGAAEDFPAYAVHVFDAAGDLRWFVIEQGMLDPTLGFSFSAFLADHVATVARAYAHQGARFAAPAFRYAADDRYLRAIPGPIAELLRRQPVLLETLATYDTRAEIREVWLDDDAEKAEADESDEDALDEDAKDAAPVVAHEVDEELIALEAKETAIRELCALPGIDDSAPLIGEPVELEDNVGALIYVMTGLDETAALATGELIARALCGELGIAAADPGDKPTYLVPADDVRLFARLLATLADDADARFDEEDDAITASREDLRELAERVARAYRDAAERGDALLVGYSRYL